MSHSDITLFDERDNTWGVFEVTTFWLSISNRTFVTKNTALGATLRSSHRLNIFQTWKNSESGQQFDSVYLVMHISRVVTTHASNIIVVKVPMEGMFILESKSIQFLICFLSHSAPADDSSYRLRAREPRCTDIWLLGLARNLFNRSSSFPYFLNNYIDWKQDIGLCKRRAAESN